MGDEQRSCRAAGTPLEVRRLGTVDYQDAWQVQRELAERRADDADAGTDTLLLLEHPPVYTAGKRTSDDERPRDGTPVIDVDRGGKLTWHGKGQLVGYPIVGLADPIDVVDYVRRLEQALISVCDSLGVPTGRIEG
ncbi:MAG: lipoyl(octanoyl) transferase LipB, partial [Sciscionella sp.]